MTPASDVNASAGDKLVSSLMGDAQELADVSEGEAPVMEFPSGGSDC